MLTVVADDHTIAQVHAMYEYQAKALWLKDDPEGFCIPKGQIFDHTLIFFGAVRRKQ